MGQSQWTEVSTKCSTSTGCCQENYADAGTIRLETTPVPETPVNWDFLEKNNGQRHSITTCITISKDTPEQINREVESGSDMKRIKARKATGFVYKNAADISDGEEDEVESNGTGANPEFGDTVSERQKQFMELSDHELFPGGGKKCTISDDLDAVLYNRTFSGQPVLLSQASGFGKAETKARCVLLNKERGKLGFYTDLDNQDSLVIAKIEKGLLEDWNAGHQESDRIAVGDSIISVNNTRGDPKLLQDMLVQYVSLKLEISPHIEFQVAIQKTKSTKLGLDVKAKRNNTTLPVLKLHQDGLIAQWNDEWHGLHPAQKVMEGDRVVAVNGESGSAEFLKKQLSTRFGSMALTFARVLPP